MVQLWENMKIFETNIARAQIVLRLSNLAIDVLAALFGNNLVGMYNLCRESSIYASKLNEIFSSSSFLFQLTIFLFLYALQFKTSLLHKTIFTSSYLPYTKPNTNNYLFFSPILNFLHSNKLLSSYPNLIFFCLLLLYT